MVTWLAQSRSRASRETSSHGTISISSYDEIRVLARALPRLALRGDDPRERARGDAVDVVVERGRRADVSIEQTLSVSVREVLELHDRSLAEPSLYRSDELVQQLLARRKVVISRDSQH